jgi:NgoPII restriction endonuclease
MESNLLKGLLNIIENNEFDIQNTFQNRNRMNSMGDALEEFIKNNFACVIKSDSIDQILNKQSEVFSYLGNTNNPPDIILKGGDAIEVKKIENISSQIALNSSYPKNKLYNTDLRITRECVKCEDQSGGWDEKDLIYSIGTLKNESLVNLWFVYGSCYCANKEIYERVSDAIRIGIQAIKDIEFTSTKELAKINKVDPLAVTYLRVRGMWGIENPIKVFDYLYRPNQNNKFNLVAIIPLDKYLSFPKEDIKKIEESKFSVMDKKIRNPNNPAKLIDVKLITYEIK